MNSLFAADHRRTLASKQASGSFSSVSVHPEVVINEMSQGPSGTKEWIEIVVISDGTDLRGWDIGDNDDGTYNEFVAFSNHADWSSLNAGTIIVIYNGADVDPLLVADSDFTDSSVSISSSNALYFTGSWGNFSNSDPDDAAALRNASNTLVHDLAHSHPLATINGPSTAQYIGYQSSYNTLSDLSNSANWITGTATSASPGQANGGLNTIWIQSLRANSYSIIIPTDLQIAQFSSDRLNIVWQKPKGTFNVDWDGVLVFLSTSSNILDMSLSGLDAIDYNANLLYSYGSEAFSNAFADTAFCIANISSDQNGDIMVEQLKNGIEYYVHLLSYKEHNGNLDNDEFSSFTALASQITSLTNVSTISTVAANSSIHFSWTTNSATLNQYWDKVIVVARENAAVDPSLNEGSLSGLVSSNDFRARSNWANRDDSNDLFDRAGLGVDSTNYVVYSGVGNSFILSGLVNGQKYHFSIFTYFNLDNNRWSIPYSSSEIPEKLPQSGDLVISEIMYNSANAGSDDEWIEFYNASGSTINLDSNWYLQFDQQVFNFGRDSLAAENYYTIAVGSGGDGVFNSNQAFVPDTNSLGVLNSLVAITNSSNKLTNSSDPISIYYQRNGSSILVDSVYYGDSSPWPEDPDGKGPSLTLNQTSANNNIGSSWSPSWNDGGTPGQEPISELLFENNQWNLIPDDRTSTLHAIIKSGDSVNISNSARLKSLEVELGASLNIPSAKYLQIEEDIQNNGRIYIDSEADLIQSSKSSANSGTGTYKLSKTYVASDHLRYSFWSSPMSNCNMETVFAQSLIGDRLSFDAVNQAFTPYANGVLHSALGYAVTPSTQLNPSTKNFTDVRNFEGELNNGAINLSLNGLQGSDYLLIGNPYPSAIDFNLFSAQNPNILASYWLWDASPIESNHSDYASWNSSGFNPVVNSQRASSDATIPAAQGFMVQVDPNFSGSSLTITFDNSQRMRSNLVTNGFYKSDPLRQVWLSLSSDSCSNSTLLCFDKNASSKFDRSFDAPAFKANTHHSFYSRLQHLDLAIQGLEPLSILKSRTIPLGMDIWRTGSYTISLDSSNLGNSDFKILLVDSLLQLKRDLEAGPYLFKLDQMGRQDNRFFLVFTKKIKPGSDPSSFEHCEGIGCYLSADRQLEVIAHDDLGPFKSIQIFNASGKLVQESNWSSNQNSVHIPLKVAEAGFYLIVAIDVNNRMYQSKILIP